MAIVHSTYSLKGALPTPDCVGTRTLSITMGWLGAVDDKGAPNDGGPEGRIFGRLTGEANVLIIGVGTASVFATSGIVASLSIGCNGTPEPVKSQACDNRSASD